MREDEKNVESQVSPETSHEELKFFFTPVDDATGEEENPHAKASTNVPDIVDALESEFGEDAIRLEKYAGEFTVHIDQDILIDLLHFLKEEKGFDYLSDLAGIDRFTEVDRYEVFYNVISLEKGKRIRIKVRVDESSMSLPTSVEVYRAANWNEREVYDMFGIRFDGHPDLRRMYMPEDFEYYPLRKEFPLLGVPGSLPLPPQVPEGELTMDPFAAAHGSKPVKSYDEPASDYTEAEN